MAIEQFRTPTLPTPPEQYSRAYMTDLSRALRDAFRLIDSESARKAYSYRAEKFIGHGQELILPQISASDSASQYAGGDNTATQVTWDTLGTSSGFTLNPAGYASPDYTGIYKIDYSLQVVNTDNVAHDVFVWLEVNGGTQVPNSSSRFTVHARKNVGDNGYLVAYSHVTFEVTAGDAIRLFWATDKAYNTTGPVDGVYLEAMAASTSPYNRPANPSAIGSIVFVSQA